VALGYFLPGAYDVDTLCLLPSAQGQRSFLIDNYTQCTLVPGARANAACVYLPLHSCFLATTTSSCAGGGVGA